MKKIYILNLIIICLCFNFAAKAQPLWSVVGNAGFSSGRADNISLAFSPSGDPYVAYAPFNNSQKISVSKWNGTTWTIVGNPDFSAGYAENISLAFNPNTSEPYVAFVDYGNSLKATVMKLPTGTSTWVNVGPAGFTPSGAKHTSLAFNPITFEPYVAFADLSQDDKASVVKYNGISWVYEGSPGFSTSMAGFTCLAFDPSTSTPYIAFKDHYYSPAKASVMKYTGGSGTGWVNVGIPGFSQNEVFEVSLAFNPVSHEPYLAYVDYLNSSSSYKATVKKFNNVSWVDVGTNPVYTGNVDDTRLSFKSNGEPYVGFIDWTNSNKATVMKFDDTNNWVFVGLPGFSPGGVAYPDLKFSPSDKPYIAFMDLANSLKATVMSFDSVIYLPTISLRDFDCNRSKVPLNDTIYSEIASYATSYEFNITSPNLDTSIIRNDNSLPLSLINRIDTNTIYEIKIRYFTQYDTSDYGTTCKIRTKRLPPYGHGYSINPVIYDSLTGKLIQSPMYVYDMYGKKYLLEDLEIPNHSDIAGIFRLHFYDEGYDGTGIPTGKGFDDPASGQDRKAILIRVFEDISQLVTANNGIPGILPNPYPSQTISRYIEIDVSHSSFFDDGTPMGATLGQGSQYFGPDVGNGITFGNIWEYIKTGYDPYFNLSNPPFNTTDNYHGAIRINFDNLPLFNNLPLTWNLDLNNTVLGNNDLDLYSVILHEAIHMLGFGSLIDGNYANSRITHTNPGIYSMFDTHLSLTINGNTVHVLNFDVDADCYDATFNTPLLSDMLGDCSSVDLKFDGCNASQQITTSSIYNAGTTFSHFNCSNTTDYVMNPGYDPGYVQRSPHQSEVEALCSLGYSITGVYGTGVLPLSQTNYTNYCPNAHSVAGLNDFYPYSSNNSPNPFTIQAGDQTGITFTTVGTNSILENDNNATKISCVELIFGGSSADLDLTGLPNSFIYRPPITFTGTALIKYRPENNAGQKGNITYIFVQVTPPPLPSCTYLSLCNENLVCYGDFEDITTQALLANLTNFFPSSLNNYDNSPGLDIYNGTNTLEHHGISTSSDNDIGCLIYNVLPVPSPHNANNNIFIGMSGYTGYSEGVCFPLKTSLIQNHTYKISFWAHPKTMDCVPNFMIYLSENPPCTPPGLWQACSNFTPNLILPQQINVANWNQYSYNFTVSNPMNFLIIRNDPNGQDYGYLDDVSIIDLTNTPLQITSVLSNDKPCIGQSFTISYHICASPPPTNNVDLVYQLPPGITIDANSDFDVNGNATILPADWVGGCVDLQLTLIVNNSAISGSPINNILKVSPGACIDGNQINDIVTPGFCVPPPDDMVAWWPLDETTGTIANDIAGFNNVGAYNGSPSPPQVAGKVQGSLEFGNMSQYIEVPNDQELDFGTGDFSIDAWIYFVQYKSTLGLEAVIVEKISSSNVGFSFYVDNGFLGLRLANGTTNITDYLSTIQLSVQGQWQHVAVTVDRDKSDDGIIFYNNAVASYTADPTNHTQSITNNDPLRIGGTNINAGWERLDEIEMFNRVLTAPEISDIFNSGGCGKCKPRGSICGFKFNDLNRDGVYNNAEPKIAGWPIQLSGDVNATINTDSSGYYCFDQLWPGNYLVSEVPKENWTQTFPSTHGTYSIALSEGQSITNINYGNYTWGVGIDFESLQPENYSVYTVPNDGLFNVSITCPTIENINIKVYNALGMVISEIRNAEVNGTMVRSIDLRPAPAGIYSVVIENGNKRVIRKIVINR